MDAYFLPGITASLSSAASCAAWPRPSASPSLCRAASSSCRSREPPQPLRFFLRGHVPAFPLVTARKGPPVGGDEQTEGDDLSQCVFHIQPQGGAVRPRAHGGEERKPDAPRPRG